MANWDKKYFVTELVNTNMLDAPWNPKFSDKEGTRLLALDDNIRKGAALNMVQIAEKINEKGWLKAKGQR